MKRKLFLLAAAVFLLTAIILPVSATESRLVDDAALLSSSEARQLESMLDEISDRYGVDLVVVTVDSTNGYSPMDFADDYYDYHDYAPDGILLLVSMEDNDWWISTTGYGITAFTDAGITYLSRQFVPYLSEGEFFTAFTVFAEQCDEFLTQAMTGDPYDSHNLPKEPFSVLKSLLISLVIGLVSALIVTGSMKGKLKSVRQQVKADDYVTPGSLQLTRSRDLLLYTHLDRRAKPQSSGGSSTHVSSSGTSHGGGGGKF